MKARVKLTPELLKRLLDGYPLVFTLSSPATEIEVMVQEDLFAKFDRVLGKMWNKVLSHLDKLT